MNTKLDFPKGWNFQQYKRYFVRIPIVGLSGRAQGVVEMYVMAKTLKQARAHARKEMLKIARISTNNAQITDET